MTAGAFFERAQEPPLTSFVCSRHVVYTPKLRQRYTEGNVSGKNCPHLPGHEINLAYLYLKTRF
jgi:hypothetical protein